MLFSLSPVPHRCFIPRVIAAEAAAYLRGTDPEKWGLYDNDKAGHKLYGQNTSNFAESENSKWLPARNLPPYNLFSDYLQHEAGQRYSRKLKALRFEKQGHIICPTVYKKYLGEVLLFCPFH
jgi:hypothetical protein